MITLIHGFNVKDPMSSVGKLKYYFHNHTQIFDYGWRFFSVLWHNKKDAERLVKEIKPNRWNILFGHSNGCAIAVEAARQGAKIDTLVCINPALKVDTKFPESIKRILVIHTKNDKPTQAARFFDKVPFIQIVIPNAWGAMGAKGYTGKDYRVTNWDLSNYLEGHSDFFRQHNLEQLMPEIKDFLSERWLN